MRVEVTTGTEDGMVKIARKYADAVSDMLATYLSAKLTFVEIGLSPEDAHTALAEVEDLVREDYAEKYKEAEAVFTGKITPDEFMMNIVRRQEP